MGLTIRGRVITALILVTVITLIVTIGCVIAGHISDLDILCPNCQGEIISYKETTTGIEYYCRDCENRWSE